MNCLLCKSKAQKHYTNHEKELLKDYWRCPTCALIFLDPVHHLTLLQQKAHYDLHQNHPQDDGYRQFLAKLTSPLLQKLKPQSEGLDYGSGPGPTIQSLLQEHGHHVVNFDPLYAKQSELLQKSYDFITCTEVVEHFLDPDTEFKNLANLLKRPQALLAIMTELEIPNNDFKNWWYHRDPTHVCFYNQQTMQWIAQSLSLRVIFTAPTVVILSS